MNSPFSSSAARAAWCVVALVIASLTPGAVLGDVRTRDLLLRLGGPPKPEAPRPRKLRISSRRASGVEAPTAARGSQVRLGVFRGARGDRTGG